MGTVIQKYVTLFGWEGQQFDATGQTENVHALTQAKNVKASWTNPIVTHNAPQDLKLVHVLSRTQEAH